MSSSVLLKVKGTVNSSSGRYEVSLEAKEGPGGGPERSLSVKAANLRVIETIKPALASGPRAAAKPRHRPRPVAMTGRPGDFMVGYDWREVLPGQAAGPRDSGLARGGRRPSPRPDPI